MNNISVNTTLPVGSLVHTHSPSASIIQALPTPIPDTFETNLRKTFQHEWWRPNAMFSFLENFSQPLASKLYDEGKAASWAGHLLGAPLAVAGGVVAGPLGVLGGIGLGLLTGASAFFSQKHVNGNYMHFIRQNPLATWADYMAQPAVNTLKMGEAATQISNASLRNAGIIASALRR